MYAQEIESIKYQMDNISIKDINKQSGQNESS
jgi:hypothetical protein